MEDRKFLFLYKVNVIMPKDRQNYIMKIYSIFSFYANHLLCFKCWWLITCGNVLDMGNLFLHSPNAEIGELVLFFCITLCRQPIGVTLSCADEQTSFGDSFQPVQSVILALLMPTQGGFECYRTDVGDRMTLVMTALGIHL